LRYLGVSEEDIFSRLNNLSKGGSGND